MVEQPPGHARLSVVVVTIEPGSGESGFKGLAATLSALELDPMHPPPEIIVPCPAAAGIAALQARFPAVRFLPAAPESPPGSSARVEELRALGVGAANGEIIALLEDHVRPEPGWGGAILE